MPTLLSGVEINVGPAAAILYVFCLPQYRGVELDTKRIEALVGSSPATTKKGIDVLVEAGYIHCTGTRGQGGKPSYILAATAPVLFPLSPEALEAPDDAQRSAKILERSVEAVPQRSKKIAERSPQNGQRSKKFLERYELRDSELSINDLKSTDSDSDGEPAPDPELEKRYKRLLAIGGVFPNVARPLAARLAADGAGFLSDLLGHLAYHYAAKISQQIGVYISDAAKHRDPAPDGYLPPADLPFDDAIAWAKNGGRTEAQVAAQREADLAARAAESEPVGVSVGVPLVGTPEPSTPPKTEDPRATLWRAVQTRLKAEMSPGAYNTHVRDARLARADWPVFVVAVPLEPSADWLRVQLAKSIKRHLAAVVERDPAYLDLTFTADRILYGQSLGQALGQSLVVAPPVPQSA